jgi:hypothetical protein
VRGAGVVIRYQWCWCSALALVSGIGIIVWHWHHLPALALPLTTSLLLLVLPAGVGDMAAVPHCHHWCWWLVVGSCDMAPLPHHCHCLAALGQWLPPPSTPQAVACVVHHLCSCCCLEWDPLSPCEQGLAAVMWVSSWHHLVVTT